MEDLSNFNEFLLNQTRTTVIFLAFFGFIGGLISSLSPCVLSLLPINLAYIGTANITNKKEAFVKASLFVLGVSTVLTLLGVFSTLAFAIFTEYKGVINLSVGIFIILMAVYLMEWIKIPLPQFISKVPEASPFIVGLVFALVSGPCSSPVLFAVLTAAGTTGSMAASMFIMFCFSVGYTAIIFFASLSAGLIKQLGWFKEHNQLVTKFSALLLALIGLVYVYIGIVNLNAF